MKVRIKLRQQLQAGPGIEIANAEANTIISLADPAAAGTAATWADIKADALADSDLYDLAYNAALDAIAAIPNESVAICDSGTPATLTVLTT